MKKIAQHSGESNVRPSVETKPGEEEQTEMSNLLRTSPNPNANPTGLVNQVYATVSLTVIVGCHGNSLNDQFFCH